MTGHYYNHPLSTEYDFVPVNGIEPLFKAYESFVLPLNYTGSSSEALREGGQYRDSIKSHPLRQCSGEAGEEIGLDTETRDAKVNEHAPHCRDHAVWARDVEDAFSIVRHFLFNKFSINDANTINSAPAAAAGAGEDIAICHLLFGLT